MSEKLSYPEPVVGALIFNPDDKVLLVKSHKWQDHYAVPGGHVEMGETTQQALVREIQEETGLEVTDLEFICFQEMVYPELFWKPRHFITFDYACRTQETAIQLNEESQDSVWTSLDEALELPLTPYTRNAITIFQKNRPNHN